MLFLLKWTKTDILIAGMKNFTVNENNVGLNVVFKCYEAFSEHI